MKLSITPQLIIEAAQKRGWNVHVYNVKMGLYRINVPDGRFFYVRGITSIKSAMINTILSDHKDILSEIVSGIGVVVPDSIKYTGDTTAANNFLEKHGKVVVKPTDQSHGNGVTVDVETSVEMTTALDYAQQFSPSIIIQQQITGDDYRVLMIGGSLAAAAIREPAYVIGDGKHTVRQLIELDNDSPRRTEGYGDVLTQIDIEVASRYLGERLDNTPETDEKVRVVGTANIGKGGVSIDVTDTISQRMLGITKTIVDHFDIGMCGVDFIVNESGDPYLIEINSGPSLGLHEFPYEGKSRGTPDKFLDWLVQP